MSIAQVRTEALTVTLSGSGSGTSIHDTGGWGPLRPQRDAGNGPGAREGGEPGDPTAVTCLGVHLYPAAQHCLPGTPDSLSETHVTAVGGCRQAGGRRFKIAAWHPQGSRSWCLRLRNTENQGEAAPALQLPPELLFFSGEERREGGGEMDERVDSHAPGPRVSRAPIPFLCSLFLHSNLPD